MHSFRNCFFCKSQRGLSIFDIFPFFNLPLVNLVANPVSSVIAIWVSVMISSAPRYQRETWYSNVQGCGPLSVACSSIQPTGWCGSGFLFFLFCEMIKENFCGMILRKLLSNGFKKTFANRSPYGAIGCILCNEATLKVLLLVAGFTCFS